MRSRTQLLSAPAIIHMPLMATILLFLVVAPPIVTAAPGNLLWENRGQPEPNGQALAIAVQGKIVVATGAVCPAACDWFVRAHDAKTGVTLWEDRVGAAGRPARRTIDRAQEVAVDAGRVFAAGALVIPEHRTDFVVRAYDLQHGTLLWQQRVDRGGSVEFAEAVVAHGGRVFVAGQVGGATGSREFALFAFDAQTGQPLWESVTDPSGLGLIDIAVALRAQGDRVFVTGFVGGGPVLGEASTALLVRAHDASTGAIVWQDEVPDVTNLFADRDHGLALQGDLLFVAGSMQSAADNFDFIVRAYDTRTGTLVWTDQVDNQALDTANAVIATGDRLFAAGWDCDASDFNCHYIIRAYVAQTGGLLWQERFNEPGGDVFSGIGQPAFGVDGGQVFLGGSVLNTNGDYEWTIRAYDAKTGTLSWQERIDGGGFLSSPNGLVADGNRLYVGGFIDKSDETLDFTVRAYITH